MTDNAFITPQDLIEFERTAPEAWSKLTHEEQEIRLAWAREHILKYFKFDCTEAKRLIDLFDSMDGQRSFFIECYAAALDKHGKQPGDWVDSITFRDEVRERTSAMMPYFGFEDWRDYLKVDKNTHEIEAWKQFCRFVIQIEFALEATGFIQNGVQQHHETILSDRSVVRINPDMIEVKA